MVNLQTLSFLISSLNQTLDTFGDNKKSIDFYKNQIQNLVNIGQVEQEVYEFMTELMNFSYIVDKEQWRLEREKLNLFTNMVGVVLTNATVGDTVDYIEAEKIANYFQNKANSKEHNKAVKMLRKLFGLPDYEVTEPKVNNNTAFGTNGFIRNRGIDKVTSNTKNKKSIKPQDLSKEEHTRLIVTRNVMRLSAAISSEYKKTTMGLKVWVKNPDAICSGDIHVFRYDLNELMDNQEYMLRLVKIYKTHGNKISLEAGYVKDKGDPCRSYYVMENNKLLAANLVATIEDISKEIDEYEIKLK